MKTISTISNLLKSSGILSALIISGAGFSAYAQNEGKIVFQSANPESGSYLTKLKDVYFTFDNPYGDVLNFGKNMIEITDGDGNVTKTTFRNQKGQIYFRTSTAGITTPGTYTVKVLADAIAGLNKTDYTAIAGTGNDEINLEYIVVEASPVAMNADLPEDYYNITSLRDIRLDLTGGYQDYGYNCDATEGLVTVTGPEGTSDLKASLTSENGVVMLSLDDDVDISGTYTFTIPENAINGKAPDGSSIVGTESGEIQLTFNYTSVPKVVFQSANPASGTYLTKLKDVYFTFDNPFGDKLNLGNNMIEITDPEGNVTTTKFRNQKGQIFFRTSSSGLTAPGKYTVKVLPDAIGELNTADYTMVPGTGNKLITLEYNVVDASPVTYEKAIPASGTSVAIIDQIYLNLSGSKDSYGYRVNDPDATLDVINAAGETVTNAKLLRDNGKITVKLDTPVKTIGEYTISIPESAISVMAPDGSAVYATENAEAITLNYTVTEYANIQFVSASPADNSIVEKIQTITTTWTGGSPIGQYVLTKEKELINVTDEEGNVVSYGTIRAAGSGIQIRITTPVTAAGKYKVNIPAQSMWPLNTATYAAVEEYTNEAVTLNYEIISIKDVALVKADPEDNSTVASLGTIVTEWEGGVEGSSLKLDPENRYPVTVTTNDEEKTQVTIGSMVMDENNKIIINLQQPVKTNGNYTVTIDAMSVLGMDANGDYTKYNSTVKLNYTVDTTTGVNTITIDQDNAGYYTLDGVKVNGNLSKGTIYIRIANGKAEKFIAR